MGTNRHRSAGWRIAWTILFALVIGARTMSPAGFMSGAVNDRVAILLCDDGQPMVQSPHAGMDHGTSGHHGSRHDGKSSKSHCPFAASPSIATADVPVAVEARALGFTALPPAAQRSQLRDGFERDARPPVRGPPLHG